MLQSVEHHEARSTEQMFPLDQKLIKLRQTEEDKRDRDGQPAHYGHRDGFVTYNDKIYIPSSLRKDVMNWYHHYQQHPGASRMERTLGAVVYWPNMSKDIRRFCTTCEAHA